MNITHDQLEDGLKKQSNIISCLNRHYWGHSSESLNGLTIGSWAKSTRVRPSDDINMIFLLPPSVYHQYQQRLGNKQSQLLQEIKNVLANTYSQTTMRGDGQVVVIPFNTITIELASGFTCTDGSIIVCDANNGGRYTVSTANAELLNLSAVDAIANNNVRPLARMAKKWKRQHDVPLKSFQLECIAAEFLRIWLYRDKDIFWYDWMMRDYFAYLIGRANSFIQVPGSGEYIALGDEWLNKARTAYNHALTACTHEHNNDEILAGLSWQEIFGADIPSVVS